jgi:hypothetical protein
VTRPRKNVDVDERTPRGVGAATATMSGESAIQANAGYPNLGKLAANRTPERRASA